MICVHGHRVDQTAMVRMQQLLSQHNISHHSPLHANIELTQDLTRTGNQTLRILSQHGRIRIFVLLP